jgi:bifunctional non-homologous end joining protein LigD
VVIWDRGTWDAQEPTENGPPESQLRRGKLAFTLRGKKLKGAFALARLSTGRTGKERLLIKGRDAHADAAWTLKSELGPQRVKALPVRTPACEAS